jgi:hypothetical protein
MPGTSMASSTVVRRAVDHRFYTWVAVGVALIVFAGFAQTYYLKAFFETPALSPLFHIHGLLMTAWFLLFFVQVRLVAAHRTDLHRRLGVAGAVLAGLIVVIGIDVGLTSARRHLAADPNSDALVFLPLPLISVVVFAIIVAAAILLRRRPEYHKRLMVLACVSILAAGIDRVPLHFVENAGRVTLFGLNDLCLAAPMAYDTLRNRKLHPAWFWGSLLFVGSQGLILAVRNMPAWLRLAAWLVK